MTPDYAAFEAEDFLTDAAFIHWVKTGDVAAERFWERFQQRHPAQQPKVQQAFRTLRALQFQSALPPEPFFVSLKEDIDKTIAGQQAGRVVPLATTGPLRKWLRVAAALVGLSVGGALLYLYLQPVATITVSTTFKQTKTLQLPDHSTVTLNAGSSLTYPQKWDNHHRDVTLAGEAFFKVQHLELQEGATPFTVHSGEVQVQVLGTEFNVKTREQTTDVMLQTGKVQLQTGGNTPPHLLAPGQLATYNAAARHLQTRNVDPAYHTAWLHHRYLFAGARLADVCRNLEDYYGLRFRIEGDQLNNKQISGTLLLNDEKELLQVLASMLNARVQQQGQTVTIASK